MCVLHQPFVRQRIVHTQTQPFGMQYSVFSTKISGAQAKVLVFPEVHDRCAVVDIHL